MARRVEECPYVHYAGLRSFPLMQERIMRSRWT